ncbi:hypothetical protein [Croceicoccus hydrothermalis]|uniref:hypothetical protein n=1 Tax=Croceicoccus hydrothermalis TaxID=2867964 RepID=UPI001EFBE367|nr:hypothetical protein [Croceicoccus hydrothermalis]
MKQYRHANWIAFRKDVIKLHNGCCVRCLRSGIDDDVVLQVHLKRYIRGRLPWDYETTDCEALCKGCHAAEHGHVMPRDGWKWVGVDDLGELDGNCELCGTEIRYVYAIEHEAWGAMAVGTDCCDHLTQTNDASKHHEIYLKSIDAKKRFVGSKRWKIRPDGTHVINQKGILVEVRETTDGFGIAMNNVLGKQRFDSIIDAKIKIFELIRSGKAQSYLASRRHRYDNFDLDSIRTSLGFNK